MAGVAAEPAKLLGPAVPHPTSGEELLLELLLHRRDVEQLEREAVTLAGHQGFVGVEPGGERGPDASSSSSGPPVMTTSLPNT